MNDEMIEIVVWIMQLNAAGDLLGFMEIEKYGRQFLYKSQKVIKI